MTATKADHTAASHRTEAARIADDAGGAVFLVIVILTAVFVAFLFGLRAEKIFSLPATIDSASREDLAAFWRAGRMAIEGMAASAYDAEAFRAGLPAPDKGLLWLNPPHFLLIVAPLGLLPFPAAKGAIIAASIASLLLMVRTINPRPVFYAAILLSPAAFASALVMQTGPMIALGLASALILSERRPILAGLILAVLTMKPQYGLFAPIFLAARGEWRAFVVASIGAATLAALSAALFGAEVWTAFFHAVSGGEIAAHGARLHRDMVTIHQTIGKLGGSESLRAIGQLAAMAIAGAGVFLAAKRWPRDAAIGFTLLASAFASPSLWVYDWPLVAAGLFMLARAGAPFPPALQLLAGALWIAPLISLGFTTMESALAAPAIFAAALGAFWFWGEKLTRNAAL